MPVRIPVVEMIEIGAGGGSIAHIDSLGRLAIGPQSAGSIPGPACYQAGGERATVTDADLVLGKIDPLAFAEGRMPLDPSLAETTLSDDIAKPIGIDLIEAAAGVAEMVEENMANAARIHSVEHGANLADYSMIAFGGAGPLHAIRLAEKLNIKRIVVPRHSSVGSAVGFLWAAMAYEVVRSRYMTTQNFDAVEANRVLESLYDEAFDVVCAGGMDAELEVRRSAYMRYAGQGHEIEVPLPADKLNDDDVAIIQAGYESHYQRLFGRVIPQRDIEILSWSVVVSTVKQSKVEAVESVKTRTVDPTAQRNGYCPQQKTMIEYPIYTRDDLNPGDHFSGPALIVEAQTTTCLTADYAVHIDSRLNLVIDRKAP